MKICVISTSGGAHRIRKERQDETQFTTKIDGFSIDGFLSFIPPLNANVQFCRFLKKISPCI